MEEHVAVYNEHTYYIVVEIKTQTRKRLDPNFKPKIRLTRICLNSIMNQLIETGFGLFLVRTWINRVGFGLRKPFPRLVGKK